MTQKISYAVVPINLRLEKQQLAVGSGFIYCRRNKFYLVTAWHNLSGRHSETLAPLHSKGGLPDNLIAWVAVSLTANDGELGQLVRMPVRFNIDDATKTSYLIHKQGWPRVDVAVIPFDPCEPLSQEAFLSTGDTREYKMPLDFEDPNGVKSRIVFLRDESLSAHMLRDSNLRLQHTVGDSLFLLGFPAGIMDQSLAPIWKRATIATDPDAGWQRQKKFLVDSASRKGMSGGPALYYDKRGRIPVPPGSSFSIGSPTHIIHGVYVGRIGDSEFEAQVGVVWRKEIIDEIIDDGMPAPSTHEVELSPSRVQLVIEAEYPKGANPDTYIEEKPGLDYLVYHVMEKIEGRANPLKVREGIIKLAKSLKQENC